MKKIFLLLMTLFVGYYGHAGFEQSGLLTARISRINDKANVMRLKVDSQNVKFISKGDLLEIWGDGETGQKRCKSEVLGKSVHHLLLKINQMNICLNKLQLTVGAKIMIFSEDYKKSLARAEDVVMLLQKKRLATYSKLQRERESLEQYLEKVESINSRYEILREKLQKEWQEELSRLESDKIDTLRRFKEYESVLTEIDHKVEKYRIYEEAIEEDRWALDQKIFR